MLTAALGYYSDLAPFSVGKKTGSELKLRVHSIESGVRFTGKVPNPVAS
jgi:hypothetical protein